MKHINRTVEGLIFLFLVALTALMAWGVAVLVVAFPAVGWVMVVVALILAISWLLGTMWSDPL